MSTERELIAENVGAPDRPRLIFFCELEGEALLDLLRRAYCDEWLAYYQYWLGAKLVKGPMKDAVGAELLQHATEELLHADMVAMRIIQLGGTPVTGPATTIFTDTFTAATWTVSHQNVFSPGLALDWKLTNVLPGGRTGSAYYGVGLSSQGDCSGDVGDVSRAMYLDSPNGVSQFEDKEQDRQGLLRKEGSRGFSPLPFLGDMRRDGRRTCRRAVRRGWPSRKE